MARLPLITLTTDFGLRDSYVAAMKGVILSMVPAARIVDITHDIPAQDVLAGAFVLAGAVPYFPPETIHVVVVDPGVGTDRRILATRLGEHTLLAPDNGVLTLIAQQLPMEAMHVVRNTRFVSAAASSTFHGRDIFAPVAAHLAGGLPLRELGPRPDAYTLLEIPEPAQQEDGSIAGQVIYVDGFGNLVSNITAEQIEAAYGELDLVEITCAGQRVGPLQGAYGFVDEGQPLAIINSSNRLEVAVNGGSASAQLQAGFGAEILVHARSVSH